MEWQPIETMPPKGTWCVGRLEGEGRPPAFVGKVYDNPFARSDPFYKATLIDEWTGNWKVVTGWMPLPPLPRRNPMSEETRLVRKLLDENDTAVVGRSGGMASTLRQIIDRHDEMEWMLTQLRTQSSAAITERQTHE